MFASVANPFVKQNLRKPENFCIKERKCHLFCWVGRQFCCAFNCCPFKKRVSNMAEDNIKQENNEQTDARNPNIRTYHGITYDITDPKFQGLSRNAIKKLLKEELWNATREQRNKYQKEKHKRKRAERRQLIEQGVIPPPPPKRPRSEDIVPSPVRVVIDCSFSAYMSEKVSRRIRYLDEWWLNCPIFVFKEIHSLQAQIVRCYSANRSTLHPMNITVTSLDEPLKKTFETKTSSYVNWKNIEFTTDSYLDKFDKASLVYLSADSDNVVDKLEDDKVYIIGGIVDKNRHKVHYTRGKWRGNLLILKRDRGYVKRKQHHKVSRQHGCRLEITLQWQADKFWLQTTVSCNGRRSGFQLRICAYLTFMAWQCMKSWSSG